MFSGAVVWAVRGPRAVGHQAKCAGCSVRQWTTNEGVRGGWRMVNGLNGECLLV